ncbi:MAG: leucine-rich repeat domain-containing protein, partial [Phycisphaerales bacterium JB039]
VGQGFERGGVGATGEDVGAEGLHVRGSVDEGGDVGAGEDVEEVGRIEVEAGCEVFEGGCAVGGEEEEGGVGFGGGQGAGVGGRGRGAARG